jgi:hypothetical protein
MAALGPAMNPSRDIDMYSTVEDIAPLSWVGEIREG